MSASCCSRNGEPLILACSGGSNVGQLTNQAAVELTREGFGKMFCLAGIGGGIESFVKSVRQSSGVVVLDGCPVGCAKAIMDKAGLPLEKYVLVTDLGIAKVKDRRLAMTDGEVEAVKQAARNTAMTLEPINAGCACGAAR